MSGTTAPVSNLDLASSSLAADPYPELAELRRKGALVRHEPTGMWLATTHAAVSQTLRCRQLGRRWSDRAPAPDLEPFNRLHRHQMMENEPPAHTRLRRPVAAAFGRGHVERLRPRIEAIAADLLDALSADPVDLVAGYAAPVPVAVIAELLGVPPVDRPRLRDWSQAMVRMYEYGQNEAVQSAAVTASADFAAYVNDLLRLRQARSGEDLVSHLVAGGGLSTDELVASVVLLLNAGHEASVNAFGNGLVAFLRHPDQCARVRRGDVGVDSAVEEVLRYDAPLQLFERTAGCDVEVAGRLVRQGEKVAALLGSANRDEAVFAAADRFDPGRDPNPHLGFGLGVHFCLGAPLARLELQVTLRALLERFPNLILAAEPRSRPTFVLHGYERIDVSLGRAA